MVWDMYENSWRCWSTVVDAMTGKSASQRIWKCRSFPAVDAAERNSSHSRSVVVMLVVAGEIMSAMHLGC